MKAARVALEDQYNPKRDVTFAWLSLLLYPLTFGAAFLVGEGVATWLFNWPSTVPPAPWKILAAAVPAVVVFAPPALPAWHFGMRGHHNGSASGRVAAWLALSIAAAFAAANVLSFIAG